MKILQLCTKVPYPPKDGGAAAVYSFSKSLSALGHQVDVLAVNPAKHFIEANTWKELPFRIIPVEITTRISIWGALRNLIFSKVPYHADRFVSELFSSQLSACLASTSFDIVQIEGIYLCAYIDHIRRNFSGKIILRAHNVEHQLWKEITAKKGWGLTKWYLTIQTKRLKKFEIRCAQKVDGIVPISEQDAHTFSKLNGMVKTIPFGVDVLTDHHSPHKNDGNLCYLGALDWMPNQEALLWFLKHVCSLVLEEWPSLFFFIAGRNAPKNIIQEIKKHPQVIFCGEIEDSAEFLQNHALMVVPLFSGSGLRVKIVEAMQNQIPVIASSKACVGLPISDGVHLKIANTALEFKQAILQSLRYPDNNHHMVNNSLMLVQQKFDNLVLAAELVKFYQTVEP